MASQTETKKNLTVDPKASADRARIQIQRKAKIDLTVLNPNGMFHTPIDWKSVEGWIERHPKEDRIHLYTAAGMAWNLAAKLTRPNIARDEKLLEMVQIAKKAICLV